MSDVFMLEYPGSEAWPGSEFEGLVFTDAAGNDTDLSTIIDEQYKEGVDGRFMAPIQHYSESVPEQDGARYRGSRVQPNLVSVPITLVANDVTQLRAKVRELGSALSPRRGMGALTVYGNDGVSRFCRCIYESGLERDPASEGEIYDAKLVLNFRAFDPFWYDTEAVVKDFGITSAPGLFFPAPPFRLGPSTVFSAFTEINDGDLDAWPVWVLTGPGTDVQLRNETNDTGLSVAGDIASGTTIVIDTRPAMKAVYRQDGTNLFGGIDGDLWALSPGPNEVSVQMTNATAATSIHLEYRAGYLGV